MRILMFGRIRKEFQCLEGQEKNSNIWKNGIKSPVFGRIRSEFECLEKQQTNSNISKNSTIVQLLKSIR